MASSIQQKTAGNVPFSQAVQTCQPKSIFVSIFSYLTPSELITAAKVCKAWKEVSYSDELSLTQKKTEIILKDILLCDKQKKENSDVICYNPHRGLIFLSKDFSDLKILNLNSFSFSFPAYNFLEFYETIVSVQCFDHCFAVVSSHSLNLFDYDWHRLSSSHYFNESVDEYEYHMLFFASCPKTNRLAVACANDENIKSILFYNVKNLTYEEVSISLTYCYNLFFLPTCLVNMNAKKGEKEISFTVLTFNNEIWKEECTFTSDIDAQEATISNEEVIDDEHFHFKDDSGEPAISFIIDVPKKTCTKFKNSAITIANGLVALVTNESPNIDLYQLQGNPVKTLLRKNKIKVISLKIIHHILMAFLKNNHVELWNFKNGQLLRSYPIHNLNNYQFEVWLPSDFTTKNYFIQANQKSFSYFNASNNQTSLGKRKREKWKQMLKD